MATITANDIHNAAAYTIVDAAYKAHKSVILTVAQQKEMFGAVVFGKKRVSYNRITRCWYVIYTTISRDMESVPYSNEKIAELVNKGEKVSR